MKVKDVDTVKNLSTAIDIILKNPAVIDVVVACADQSTDDLKKIASAIPCLYPEKCKFTVIIAKISYKKGNNIINQGSVLTEP